MAPQKKTVGLATGREGKRKSLGLPKNPSDRPTLAEAGINKNLAHEGRRLGALSYREFEEEVEQERAKVDLRASGLSANPAAPSPIARCIEVVKQAVATAAKKMPRERVLKTLWDEIGIPEDCGPGSAAELAGK